MDSTTKPCLLYIIHAQGSSLCKIGITTDLPSRLRTIQTGCPYRCVVLATWPGSREIEARLHRHFAAYRRAGEWFELPAFCGKQIWDVIHTPPPAKKRALLRETSRRDPVTPSPHRLAGWKRSRFLRGYLLRRVPGYNVVETPWGVSYLGVVSRKPDRTSADKSVFGFAGYFNWESLMASGLAVPVEREKGRSSSGRPLGAG